MPEVSIIIPVYNKDKYIKELLVQIERQEYKDFECILVDDGSTDDSGNICDRVSEKDKRFKVIHLANSGVSNARNVGMNCAKGKYITFVDADDKVASTYIENLYNCITKNESDLVISGVVKFWENNDRTVAQIPPYYGLKDKKDILDEFANVQKNTGIYGICVAKIFSRDLIDDIRFDTNIKLAEDFAFYLKIYSKIKTIYFDNNSLYYYLQEAENSSTKIEDKFIDYIAQAEIQISYREFFRTSECYLRDNKDIVDRNIDNYFYFALYYSVPEMFDYHFDKLYLLYRLNNLKLSGLGIGQKILLNLLKRNNKKLAKSLVYFYRGIKNVLHRR